jgi:hypothetical protein
VLCCDEWNEGESLGSRLRQKHLMNAQQVANAHSYFRFNKHFHPGNMSKDQTTVADSQAPIQDEPAPPTAPDPILNHQVKIEEGSVAYRPGGFHPVYIGDVFNDRYKVLNKIGYGIYSTVWLVKDLKNE